MLRAVLGGRVLGVFRLLTAVSPFLMSSPFRETLSYGAAWVQISIFSSRFLVFSSIMTAFAPLGMGCPVQTCLASLWVVSLSVSASVNLKSNGLDCDAPVGVFGSDGVSVDCGSVESWQVFACDYVFGEDSVEGFS